MKYKKKIIAILLTIVLISLNTATALAVDLNDSITKDENVYIILNSDGTVKKQIVSCWVHSDDGLKGVEDISALKDITNVKSTVEPQIDGGRVLWNTDETDIYYNGTIEKQPPISVAVEYTFDGKRMKAEDLIGKSGKLTINIKLQNNLKETKMIEGKSRTIYTPLAATIVMDLPNDIFTQVKAEDAQIFTDSRHQIINYVTLPGIADNFDGIMEDALEDFDSNLKEEFNITADVEDFEMPEIVIAAATSLVDLKDININDKVTELTEGIDELEEASKKIEDGVSLLSDKLDEFDGKMGELRNGYAKFDNAVKDVLAGTSQLVSGTDQLKNASLLLKTKVTDELIPGLNGSEGIQNQLTEKMQVLETQLASMHLPDMEALQTQLLNAINSVCDTSSNVTIQVLTGQTFDNLNPDQQAALTNGKNQIKQNAATQIAEMMGALDLSDLENLKVTLTEIKGLSDQLMGSMRLLTNSLYNPNDDPSNPQTLANAIFALAIGADDLYEGTKDLQSGVSKLSGGSDNIESKIKAFNDASGQLSDKSGKLDNGMDEFVNEGLSEIYDSNMIKDLSTAVAIKDEMQAQADAYNSYSGSPDGISSTVKFIMKFDEIDGNQIDQSEEVAPLAEASEANDNSLIWTLVGGFIVIVIGVIYAFKRNRSKTLKA